MKESIDSIAEIDLGAASAKTLRIRYFTGRSNSQGSGRNKVYTYRTGAKTDLGDIEISVWIDASKAVIHRDGHDDELARLAAEDGMARLLMNNRWLMGREKTKVFCFVHMLEKALRGGEEHSEKSE